MNFRSEYEVPARRLGAEYDSHKGVQKASPQSYSRNVLHSIPIMLSLENAKKKPTFPIGFLGPQ